MAVQSTGFADQLSAVIYSVSERPLSTASYFRFGSELAVRLRQLAAITSH